MNAHNTSEVCLHPYTDLADIMQHVFLRWCIHLLTLTIFGASFGAAGVGSRPAACFSYSPFGMAALSLGEVFALLFQNLFPSISEFLEAGWTKSCWILN